MTTLDYSKITDITIEGIDYGDCPDYCDAYVESAKYDGRSMTQDELDEINDNKDWLYEKVFNYLH